MPERNSVFLLVSATSQVDPYKKYTPATISRIVHPEEFYHYCMILEDGALIPSFKSNTKRNFIGWCFVSANDTVNMIKVSNV